MQDDMANLRKFEKTEEEIYSDFYNSGRTLTQYPQDEVVRVGFNERQVDNFKEWDVVATVANDEGLIVFIKMQNEKYFPVIAKMLYKTSGMPPYSVEQIV